ncbi:MAG: LacI family transcriptional regulator [Ignavibacteriae bacterium]|nr:MAG: LacI family transcriptional regulator [Ignavibacteriota bacterium]
MKKRFPITLGDIASRLHVSPVTVSKALRDQPDISKETTIRIKILALEMGYIPDYTARNLASNNTHTIGVVIPKIAHSFFSSVIEAIYDAAHEQGYEIILAVSQEDASRELQHLHTLISMRVEGIIITVSQQTKDYTFFHRVKEFDIPLTFMDRAVDVEGFSKVLADDRGGAYAATEQAVNAGYSRIAHFSGYPHTSIGREQLLGFESAMKDNNIEVNPEWVIQTGFSEQDGYDGFLRLYRSGNMPECIFTVSFPVALGIYRAVRELKLTIPDDIDLISFGNCTLDNVLAPSLTYIDQSTGELGRAALNLTIKNIQEKDKFVPQTITLPTRLVLRGTCLPSIRRNIPSSPVSIDKSGVILGYIPTAGSRGKTRKN